MIERGDVVEFKDKNRVACGVVLVAGPKNVRVFTPDAREIKVDVDKVLHRSSGLSADSEKDLLVFRIREIDEAREALKKEIQLRLLWEIVREDLEPKSADLLAQIYFGNGMGSHETAAMLRALYEDPGYFRYRSAGFFPVDEKNVLAMEVGRRAQELHLKREEAFVTWLQGGGSGSPPEESASFLEALKDLVVFGEQASRPHGAQNLLRKAKIHDLESVFSVLEKAGILKEDENIFLARYQVPREFPAPVQRCARELLEAGLAETERADLTHLDVFTVDDEHTTDVDDALSLEALPEGWRAGVHIADVSELVPRDSVLDREAHTRSTSIYLPAEKIQMLPPGITEAASLLYRKRRPALSVLAYFHPNGHMTSWELRESWIRVKQRLNYEEVDDRLNADPMLQRLYQMALAFQEERRKSGALIINVPRVEVHVDPETREIGIKEARPRSRSQVLVSEWMVFANRLAANYCLQSKIPAIFRTQQPPGKVLPYAEGDLATLYKQRRFLRKGEASVEPMPHHGLGLPVYLQMTSPIRRYSDLVMHRQLKASLKKERPPYTNEDLEGILAYSERWVEIAEIVERESRRYWMLKYLERRIGQNFDAVVLEASLNDYLLLLTSLALEVSCPRGLKDFAEGDALEVKVELVKPRLGLVKVMPV